MLAAIKRDTLQVSRGGNRATHPTADWLQVDPDTPNATTFNTVPSKYWVAPIVGDTLDVQSASEQAATDAAILAEQRDNFVAIFNDREDVLGNFLLVLVDEFAIHAQRANEDRDALGELLQAIADANNLGDIKDAAAAITLPSDVPDRTNGGTRTPQEIIDLLRTAIRNKMGT